MEGEEGPDSVFELLTKLCDKTASQYCVTNKASQKRLAHKMRSHAYEIILKKSAKEVNCYSKGAHVDLLAYYLVSHQNVKNVAEFKRSVELKKLISSIRNTEFGTQKCVVENVLKLLVGLSDSVKEDPGAELFQTPFSFGMLDQMLPKLKRERADAPEPYPYYPPHVFELPYSTIQQEKHLSAQGSYPVYTVESFDSRSWLPDHKSNLEIKSFLSPMSLLTLSTSTLAPDPYLSSVFVNCPRLTGPRDLQIPKTESNDHHNIKVTFASNADVQEVYRAPKQDNSVDIWEIVTQIDKDVPNDLWETAAKLPPIHERQLIATSPREMALWRRTYEAALGDLYLVSEKLFIRHIMYLIIGIETKSFPFNQETNSFYMKEGLIIEGVSKELIRGYVTDLLLVGTYYKRLFNFAFNQTLEDHHGNGLVYEAAREVIRRYLLQFRLKATSIYEECTKASNEELNCMPTLLQILNHMEPFKYEIETVVSIYKLIDTGSQTTLPHGAELMSYLFNEISLITHRHTALTMFSSLYSICKVYFKFIERFIFEGELDDKYNEFFIRKDSQYVHTRSKRYWDKGFHFIQSCAVPEFLRPLAKFILLCGKSLRLLKHCNPCDPLVLLISSDHPSITCCATFEELERQQQILDVYRTRCLFVSGEPATFDQILLKREAEGKAFAEMAALKQAETMEKIMAERKRLARLIIAEKQHSLRVLENAMAEAKAAKSRARIRQRTLDHLEAEADKAAEEVDSILKDQERNKIMEYYSKLNMEVEKSKLHSEWKIKRLQLDQSRMQLLSTEERNLKREKLELEYKKNEEAMVTSVMSTTSQDLKSDDDRDTIETDKFCDAIEPFSDSNISFDVTNDTNITGVQITESQTSDIPIEAKETKSKMHVISAICNAAKSIFGGSKTDQRICDNKKTLDAQGNEVPVDNENNTQVLKPSESKTSMKLHTSTSSEVIGSCINKVVDNIEFMKAREEATKNKLKVMAHEFGVDTQNNQVKVRTTNPAMDDENNIKDLTNPNWEAKRNKLKVLGTEFGTTSCPKTCVSDPITTAQKEALINKQKVLGVEYNLPMDVLGRKDPANVAQEEAVRNKEKMLGSNEMKPMETGAKRESMKRSGLTLNLKPFSERNVSELDIDVSNSGAITPGDLFTRLDLETPTTADIPLEGALTSEVFTPHSDSNVLDAISSKEEKDYLSGDGFDFSMIVDESVESENTPEGGVDDSDSSNKKIELEPIDTRPVINYLDGTYTLANFDPFGVKNFKHYSNHFSSKMDLVSTPSSYTHPAVIMEEVRKRPYGNMFTSHFSPEEDEDQKVTCDNISTLTACLQRSVMLPLTYQLEVVNNSILTYFLVNLEMYEHLRSLKDYFFLMDGEFSKSICQNLFTRLVKTLNPQELLNFATLHNILDKALGSSISHVHKFSENLSFTISETPLSFQHSTPDVLQCLSLTYTVNWPLNIILSQEALARYAKVFQFLVKMRRISWILGEDFGTLKLAAKISKEHSRTLLRSPHYISIQIFRHVMASLVRALDSYIVTTCIVSSWNEFENDLKKARTLDDLYECHVVYIKKVLFRCLLNNRSAPVMKLLNDIFTVILKFSRLLKAGEWRQTEPNGPFTHTSFGQLQELFHIFEKLAKYLHKVVTRMMECGYQRHLVELLTMVNLNGYYDPDKSREEHNTTTQST